MKSPYEVILKPVLSEKSTAAMGQDKYTFFVSRDASRTDIKDAVEAAFKVRVKAVNTQNRQGKMRRMGVHTGRKPGTKKAVVTLEPGQRIPFFEGLTK
ncbi:MAG: 50S ribosomal protein L23 [Bacillota bacterium]|nr:50S ribosomal protein L23 [Bacillota bacterium]